MVWPLLLAQALSSRAADAAVASPSVLKRALSNFLFITRSIFNSFALFAQLWRIVGR